MDFAAEKAHDDDRRSGDSGEGGSGAAVLDSGRELALEHQGSMASSPGESKAPAMRRRRLSTTTAGEVARAASERGEGLLGGLVLGGRVGEA